MKIVEIKRRRICENVSVSTDSTSKFSNIPVVMRSSYDLPFILEHYSNIYIYICIKYN